MSVYEYNDYKIWVHDRLKSLPKEGRGQLKRIAEHLNTSPTIVTQVFNGDRELTPEQALSLADYFTLNKNESRFLILLVNYARTSSHRYKLSLKEEIEEARLRAREISHRVRQNFALTQEAKSILYSNWYYLAIWSLTAVPGFDHLEAIASHLKISKKKTREALEYLIKFSLVLEDEQGRLKVGPTLLHLESSSPQIPRHHQNWRLQAFNRYENPSPESIHYTAPVTLSVEDVNRVRENTLKFISDNVNIIKESSSEKLYCLCIDWFEV